MMLSDYSFTGLTKEDADKTFNDALSKFNGTKKRSERLEVAKVALNGILTNCARDEIGYKNWHIDVASNALKVADELIKQIDEGENNG